LTCKLMVIGHISIDRIDTQHGTRTQAGGAALYAAMAARTLLKDIALVSAIGKDYKFMDTLRLLDTDCVRIFRMPSTRFNIRYNRLGEAEYTGTEYGAGLKVTAHIVPSSLLTPETIVHISPMQPAKVNKIVEKIHESSPKTKISINTWAGYIEKSRTGRKILKDLALEADFFILNDYEAKVLTKAASLSTALKLLKAKMVIVTLGEFGAIISGRDQGIQMVPALNIPAREIVDATGAGDTWSGAFLAAYILTEDLMKSVTTASVISSIKCSGWNFQKLINLKFKGPDDVIEYVIGLKEGSLQKIIPDYTMNGRA